MAREPEVVPLPSPGASFKNCKNEERHRVSGVSVHGALHPVITGKAAGNVAGELDSRERPATRQETWPYQVQLAWKLEVRLLRLSEQNNAIQFCDSRACLEVNLEDCRCDTVTIRLKHLKRSNGVVMGCF